MKNLFGMFVHWGLYSITGVHEQVFARNDLDREEYENLMHQFNPVKYDPEEWVIMAKNAGMEYICFTTKHHDGFCMWDTKYTSYNIMNTPYGKDVLRMLADACKKHGMKLSLYYSNPDWHHPYGYNPNSSHQWKCVNQDTVDTEKYREFVKNQITELLTNYGEIYTLFWDIPPRYTDESMNALVRSLQPNILINDRGYSAGDFSTPERTVPDGSRFERMTEACQSVGVQSWGYRTNEDYYSTSFLMSSIDKIMAMGGSYLLNVGPMPDGTICPQAKKILQRIGGWYTRVCDTLKDTQPDPFQYELDNLSPQDPFIAVAKNGKTYFHFYNGLSTTCVTFLKCPGVPEAAKVVNTGAEIGIRYECLPTHRSDADGKSSGPFVSLCDIPTDDLGNQPVILEVEW